MRVAGSVNGQFWLLALVAGAGLLVWVLQWRASIHAQDGPQIAAVTEVAPPAPQPQHGASGATERADAGRKLFGPLRSQAPMVSGTVTNGEPALQKRQFALLGTTLTGERHMALVREIVSGESRVVDEGAQLAGMTVTVVQHDRIFLRAGQDIEELELQRDAAAPVSAEPGKTSDVAVPAWARESVANASNAQPAPTTSPAPVDIATMIEKGESVPNPN